MGVKQQYKVMVIDKFQTYDWLLHKHYAKRIPSIEHSFGVYDSDLVGVCTFGSPPRVMNSGESIFKQYRVKTFELNRLVVNDGLCKNVLSFFVSNCLKFLPKPCCVVSYADSTFGHNGYIYQATNWIYTGLNQVHEKEWFLNGKEIHQRTLSSMGLTSSDLKIKSGLISGEYTKKHRYFHFCGNKKEVSLMKRELIYQVEPYPKGDNKRYDASCKVFVQKELFNF